MSTDLAAQARKAAGQGFTAEKWGITVTVNGLGEMVGLTLPLEPDAEQVLSVYRKARLAAHLWARDQEIC